MLTAADLADVFHDVATACHVQGEGEDAPRPVLMIVRALGSGSVNSRNTMLACIDTSILPRGADWGYGLLRASDAPTGMHPETKLTITDSSGHLWSCEAAKAVYALDTQTRKNVVIAWRLALRGKQRMVRAGSGGGR